MLSAPVQNKPGLVALSLSVRDRRSRERRRRDNVAARGRIKNIKSKPG